MPSGLRRSACTRPGDCTADERLFRGRRRTSCPNRAERKPRSTSLVQAEPSTLEHSNRVFYKTDAANAEISTTTNSGKRNRRYVTVGTFCPAHRHARLRETDWVNAEDFQFRWRREGWCHRRTLIHGVQPLRPKNPETSDIAKMSCEATSNHQHSVHVHVNKMSQIHLMNRRSANNAWALRPWRCCCCC